MPVPYALRQRQNRVIHTFHRHMGRNSTGPKWSKFLQNLREPVCSAETTLALLLGTVEGLVGALEEGFRVVLGP
jgi:hypothetical protein